MPTNYTGDGTAAESPALAPSFANPVVLALPAGLEARNASSIYQAFKYLANVAAFLMTKVAEVYTYKTLVRKQWFPPSTFTLGTNWALVESGAGLFYASCPTASGSGSLAFVIPLFYNASKYQRATSISVLMFKNGTGTTTVTLANAINLSTTTPATSVGITNATSTTSGIQTITIPWSSLQQTADSYVYVYLNAANNSDAVYGVSVTYDNSTIVYP